MKNYLPTISDVTSLADNLRAARLEVGNGPGMAGSTILKVHHLTGEVTFGQDKTPLPKDHKFVVGLHNIVHGYLVCTPPPVKVLERHVTPMAQGGTRPTPPDGKYGTYETGGANDATVISLSSIDEPGFELEFTAWGSGYNANRIGDLLDKTVVHMGTADGQSGFVHPVVTITSAFDANKKWGRDIWFIDFVYVDWLHRDGKTLLSERAIQIDGDGHERMPWDDEDSLTDNERELLGTS